MSAPRTGVAAGDWDAAVHAWGGHFLQSVAWQRVQHALGYPVLHSRGDGWAWAGAVRTGRFPRYLYVPYGPTAARGAAAPLRDAMDAARQQRLDFVRAEPIAPDAAAALHGGGAVHTSSIQPRWTWVLDITQPEDVLRRGLSAGHRGSINAAPRHGLTLRSSADPADIDVLCSLQERAAGARGYRGQSRRYHRAEAAVLMPLGAARLYIAEAGGSAVAAALSFDWCGTRYYAHAASDPVSGRKLGAAAPLVWQMILDARADGAARFDFWGVLPGAPQGHPWAGFSRFKMAFGGALVERAGTWDLPVRRVRHRLYAATRKLR